MEGHHVLELLRVLLQRGQATCAGTELVLVEPGASHPGDTRGGSQSPRLNTSLHFKKMSWGEEKMVSGAEISGTGAEVGNAALGRGPGWVLPILPDWKLLNQNVYNVAPTLLEFLQPQPETSQSSQKKTMVSSLLWWQGLQAKQTNQTNKKQDPCLEEALSTGCGEAFLLP